MIDELQSPSSSKKRKSAATDPLPGQRRRLAKKPKTTGDIAGTCALSQSPSKSSINNSPVTSSSRTIRIQSSKNAKAGPCTKSNITSQSRDPTTPIRVSSRVSRPTSKKKALLSERKSPSPESDGFPPRSIITPIPPSSLKRKKPTNGPKKRLAEDNTPSKSKCRRLEIESSFIYSLLNVVSSGLDPNPIELTSSDDASRARPQKRVKQTRKKPLSPEVIDLCSESEDVTSPRRTLTRDEAPVLVLSTDNEDLEFPSFSCLAVRETDSKERPALPSLGDISPPIGDESVFRASPSPRTHNIPVPKPKAPVAEDGVTDGNNRVAEKVDFPRGSLQALYNEALARCARQPQHAIDIADQPSPFSSLKCIPPAHTIHDSTPSQSPTLHTPLFFDRIILRLRARLKPRKTLDATAFSDDTNLGSTEAKINEEQEDAWTYPDTVMELSTVESEAREVATKTIFVSSTEFQDDALSDTQATGISPSVLVNDPDVNERPLSKAPSPPSPLENQESTLPPEVVMLEDTVPENIQAQEVSANYRIATPERETPSAISPNMLCKNVQVATIEPSILKGAQFLVQALRRRYDASKISGSSTLPASELNETAKSSGAPELLSESLLPSMEHATNTFLPVASSEDTSSASKCLSESPMILTNQATIRDISLHTTSGTEDASSISKLSETPTIILTEHATPLNLSLLAGSSSEDALSDADCLSGSPSIPTEHAITPTAFSLASSSSANTLSSRNSSPSARSLQSSDSSASIESVNCLLVTPDDSPSPLTPPVKSQKQKPFINSNPSLSPIDVSFFDTDLCGLNLRTLIGNSKFDEDDDDDDISVSGMELVYPEEIV
ncbi:hypothetical protein BYT27DRAFT_7246316 [Phlegmacium glaucopus]|nr:hypothetical protein BYT27DRAFT_7246316 [Phlegmacium glaucopus]